MIIINRRHFIQLGAAGLMAASAPCRAVFAQAATKKRLVVVILRGGMDGLQAVIPYTDYAYQSARGTMAMRPDDGNMIMLDREFAMHRALAPLAELYQQRELAFVHGVGIPYRDRSHFDAQMVLECGLNNASTGNGGWLNRAIAGIPHLDGINIGPSMPLIMQGQAQISAWSPSHTQGVNNGILQRVGRILQDDPLLHPAFDEARRMKEMGGGNAGGNFPQMMAQTARFLSREDGPRIAAIDLGGWDTHENQGLADGILPGMFRELSRGITNLKRELGYIWQDTAVVMVTEFGRTVMGNGTDGTDHGVGSVALVAGGGVAGGKMYGDYPGLTNLYQGRDLMPINDMRRIFKAALMQHVGLDFDHIEQTVFPNSRDILAFPGMFQT